MSWSGTDDKRRDLSFVPVCPERARHLTRAQIEQYNTEGFLAPIGVFDTAESDTNRSYFDHLLGQMQGLKDNRDGNYAINGYHVCCEGLWDLATHPRILDLVEDIVGPNIVAWGSHFFCKQPGDPKHVPWHQDASYWPFTPARTVTMWLAIDDTDVENAAMQFLPRTHNVGHIAWKHTDKPAVLGQEIPDIGRFGQPVWDTLKAGELSLHADMLAHGSGPNPSGRRRCGLTIRYCPPDVVSLDPAWMRQAIVCRGTDPTGNWIHNPRPRGDNLCADRKPKSIGAN